MKHTPLHPDLSNPSWPLRFDEPATLDERLRYIDIKFESLALALEVYPSRGCFAGETPPPHPERQALIRQLTIDAMQAEGLPMSLYTELGARG